VTSRARTLTLLLILVGALTVAATALASPDGDDDPTYNAGSGFGTRYTEIMATGEAFGVFPADSARPVTDQAPDGSSVTAVLVFLNEEGPDHYAIHLSRLGIDGKPTGFGTTLYRLPDNTEEYYEELLDIRVLSSGNIVVLARQQHPGAGNEDLVAVTFNAAGVQQTTTHFTACGLGPQEPAGRVAAPEYAFNDLDAARVESGGAVTSLWDCRAPEEENPDPETDLRAGGRLIADGGNDVYVVRTTGTTQNAAQLLPKGQFGEDLELGPTGDPYALVGTLSESNGSRASNQYSNVFHLQQGTLALQPATGGSVDVDGLPVDLAVDNHSRPLVWTEPPVPPRLNENDWRIFRLQPGLTALDTGWGTGGQAVVSDPRLETATGYRRGFKQNFLVVRPDDRVLATGGYEPQTQNRSADDPWNGIIAGLTAGGKTDTGFATNGFKPFSFSAGDSSFVRIGEPTLQSDGKVLIPHVTDSNIRDRAARDRIASPPSDDLQVGVTRLGPPAGVSGIGAAESNPPLRPSATPTICGRRAISLVRADVRGRRIKLTGLVGAALYGKRVTIQTDPKGARSSRFTRTTTVRASRTGNFTAFVKRPKRSDFVSVRYRAVSGSARSPKLKLPQSLTSRSVKSAKGTITVKGRVKNSVLGKRNRVKIRRLVCGRYRTVGTAKPDENGNYTVTFSSTQLRGVAFYRAESRVLRKRGSKVYVIQYARAIAIRTTSQTG